MDQVASECAHCLREWFLGQIEDARPVEAVEVVMKTDGSVPAMPTLSGEFQTPIDPPPPRRYWTNVSVQVPDLDATDFVERLIARVRNAVEEDWTLGGLVERAEITVTESRTEDDSIEVEFSTLVGFPAR